MTTHRLIIKTFSAPSPHCFIKQMSPSMLTPSSALWSLSLHCYLFHVQMRTRRSSQPNNFVALPAYGGTITMLCSRLVMSSLGMNFGLLSERHIPEGLIERKLNEFLNLTQGTRTVMQYAQVFNHLCQYAGYHADTDARKRDRFRRGLNTKLKERLNLVKADTFNELVNMAITQEDCISAHWAEKK
jgi:hypothetical protein